MTSAYECKVITDTVDLAKKKHVFIIEEPDGIYFFRRDMKIECISLDSGEGRFAAKPGKISKDYGAKTVGQSKKSKIEYTPDVKTMPGKYKLHVVFKCKQQNGQYAKIGTISAEFKVIDTTPIGIFQGRGKTNYLIDLNRSRSSWREPVTLHVQGPRNQQVNLVLCYARDENDNPCTIGDPKTIGAFKKARIKLSGGGAQDAVIYYPGPGARSGQVVATAHFGKIPKKLKFTFHYRDVKCNVFYQGRPINQEEKILVFLEYSLGTAFRKKYKYKTILQSKFAFIGPKESRVSIKMNWNGDHCGHNHDMASYNELATGYFTNFTQSGDNWLPGGSLITGDGTVNYRNIDYVSYGMSGEIKVLVAFSTKENAPIKSIAFYLWVLYPGLMPMDVEEGDNIVLDGKTDSHPDNHYGTQKLIDAIRKMAKAYGEAYDRGEFNSKNRNKPIRQLYINDMSLRFGGRFDHKQTLKPPHKEHVFGEDADIQIKEMNAKQRAWFDRNAELNGFVRRDLEPKGSPNHFHCSVVSAT